MSPPAACHPCHHQLHVSHVTTSCMSPMSPPAACHPCHHQLHASHVTPSCMSAVSPPAACHLHHHQSHTSHATTSPLSTPPPVTCLRTEPPGVPTCLCSSAGGCTQYRPSSCQSTPPWLAASPGAEQISHCCGMSGSTEERGGEGGGQERGGKDEEGDTT